MSFVEVGKMFMKKVLQKVFWACIIVCEPTSKHIKSTVFYHIGVFKQ